MSFEDLTAHFDARLRLPINGKTYVIEELGVDVGLRVQAIVSIGISAVRAKKNGESFTIDDKDKVVLDDAGEHDLYRDVLGATYDEMVADGVSWPKLKHAAGTVMVDSAVGRAQAEAFWAGRGKRPAPADRKPAKKATTSARSRSTAAARTTRKRASTSGTTSPQA